MPLSLNNNRGSQARSQDFCWGGGGGVRMSASGVKCRAPQAVLLKEDWKKIDIFISVSNGNYINQPESVC